MVAVVDKRKLLNKSTLVLGTLSRAWGLQKPVSQKCRNQNDRDSEVGGSCNGPADWHESSTPSMTEPQTNSRLLNKR